MLLEAILGVITLTALGASFVAPEKHRANMQGFAVITGLVLVVLLAAGSTGGNVADDCSPGYGGYDC